MTDQINKKALIRGANIISAVLSRAVAESEAERDSFPPATKTTLFRIQAAFAGPLRLKTVVATDRSMKVDFFHTGDALLAKIYSVGPSAIRAHKGQDAELRSLNGDLCKRFTFDAYGKGEVTLNAKADNDALARGFDIEVARKWEAAK